jgi:hypothetical protein
LSSLAFVLKVLAEGTVAMPDLSIHNETEFSLTPTMLEQIQRDAIENFGEAVRSIKVQYGIERHAFNVRTGEVRYAFSPGDFGLVDRAVSLLEPYFQRSEVPTIDDDTEEELIPGTFDEIETDEESDTTESLESLDEELEEDEEDEAVVAFQGIEEDEEDEEDEEEEDQFDEIDDEGGFIYEDDDYN